MCLPLKSGISVPWEQLPPLSRWCWEVIVLHSARVDLSSSKVAEKTGDMRWQGNLAAELKEFLLRVNAGCYQLWLLVSLTVAWPTQHLNRDPRY